VDTHLLHSMVTKLQAQDLPLKFMLGFSSLSLAFFSILVQKNTTKEIVISLDIIIILMCYVCVIPLL
jgi:hypothetical protein